MSLQMKVECPQCSKIWTLNQGSPGVLCNCHLYCTQGDKPSDCSVSEYTHNGKLSWPAGMHLGEDDSRSDIFNITYYCATHTEYYTKVPIWIDADWFTWFSTRAPSELRLHRGEV